ncbi:hypothetical protein DLAC_05891 [Tieghemostelium lacteum]|uniref:Transmembrane protein n=1 Tax=Tieghemostelium lacteum TaxID=361077 RepID=A0A151ZGY7_TIELA|nr:hypothetical protein DLAC_05891 [Tieghemostelium lacteum]|eukprot:KYQ93241.1 hypothetical protein DLAC_05891 [Tieghemostelium lacteum]
MAINLVDQAASYGAYHNNNVNKFIHIVFVPLIVYTILIFLNYASIPVLLEPYLNILHQIHPYYLPLSISTPVAIALALFYCFLDIRVGGAATFWLLFANVYAQKAIITFGPQTLQYAIILHIFSWITQFVGHGVFEGRRPALIDNIFQVFIAPFFVTLEVLFLVGLLKSERTKVEHKIHKNIEQLNKLQKTK